MADPLTEPGEYENLPFHGLQTAPNKFTTPTTPTNFNNNTNVVRSVPRPKRLNGNISQNTIATAPATTQANYYDENETETQQQYYHQQQQQQYSTMPYNRHTPHATQATTISAATLSGKQTLIPNSVSATSNSLARNEGGIIVHNSSNSNSLLQQQQQQTTTSTNPHQMTYNLNNCFPKSYTEYYQQQQQQQQQLHQQHPSQHHQFSQKFNNSTMINAIEHDFNTYAVVERQQPPPPLPPMVGSKVGTSNTNPFLAVSNFKKFDTSGDEDLQTGNYQTASMKRQGKRKTFADKLEDKRFYSLKFTGNKQKQQNKSSAAALNINHSFSNGSSAGGVLGSLLSSSANKCKRHHSFAGGGLGDVDPKGPAARNAHMNFYDPPAYENVNDSVQVHSSAVSDMELPDGCNGSSQTATVLLHPLPYGMAGGSQGPKKKRRQRRHQPKEDLNLIEPERLSIYRSDSGISNSSYECVTPLPASTQTPGSKPPPGKMPRTPKTPKTPKGHKNQTLAHTAVTAHFNSSHKKPAPRVPPTPLYMNVNDQPQQQHATNNSISNLERPSSPSSTMATSAYESASSSQNDNTCNDPISLSSTTSLYSGGGGNIKSSLTTINQRCNRHQQPPEITTPEEFEQFQLGHHAHAHSSSSLSVASSASGSNAGGRVKCKKQQQQQQRLNGGQGVLTNHLELNKRKPLANNPFLATNPAATTTATCHKKLHRRQTISDPYAHIKHINECRRQSNNNSKTHNYCAKSKNAFKATAAATTDDTQSSSTTIFKSQRQQAGIQQYNQTKQPFPTATTSLSYTTTCNDATATSCHQYATTHNQQQMLMHKNVLVNNNCKNPINDNTRPFKAVVIHVADHKNKENEYKSHNQSQRSLISDMTVKQDNDIVQQKTEVHNEGYIERPVKLPLRKYHSFHFQTTQTVSGQPVSRLQQLQQLHLQQQSSDLQDSSSEMSSISTPYAKQGPLIFRPYKLDENVSFKPIQPSEESEDSIDYVREYVGTVEKFLKDEEKYMDSGDFTNLTQRLKQQQEFLNSANSSEKEDLKDNQIYGVQQQSDSEPNSLYEDINYKPKSLLQEQKLDFKESVVNLRDIPQGYRKENKHENLKDSQDKGQHFISSSRALNLLKTVIESDSNPSEEEKSPEHRVTTSQSRDICTETSNTQCSSSSDLNRNPGSLDKEKLETQDLIRIQSRINEDIYSEVARNPTISCKRSESQKSLKSPKVVNLSLKHEESLNNEHYKIMESIPSKHSRAQYSSKLSSLSCNNQESVNAEHYSDMNRNAMNLDVLTKSSTSSDSIQYKDMNKQNSKGVSEDNFYESIYSPKHYNEEKSSQILKTSRILKDESNETSLNTQISTITKPLQDSLNNNNTPGELTAKVYSPLNSNLSRKSSLKYLDATDDNSNVTKHSTTLVARKSLEFPAQTAELPQIKQMPTVSVLSEKDLEKVFKPYEQQKTIEISQKYENKERPVSTILNPAASLEALELLTKSNPELWSTNQAGSRHNLHQLELFHSLQKQHKNTTTKERRGEEEEEQDVIEDLGYSFCEEEIDDMEEEGEKNQNDFTTPNSPFVNVIMAPNSPAKSQVKYILKQNHGEVHI